MFRITISEIVEENVKKRQKTAYFCCVSVADDFTAFDWLVGGAMTLEYTRKMVGVRSSLSQIQMAF